ncbi:hypothetical protein, partial [Bifidobacterium breve]|uniref:hypothetical protein n=1 Tax=Bifidobacterium breve TaxID=1685 RepID=UPI0034A5581F
MLPLHHIRMAGVPERFRTVSPPIGDRRAFPHPGTKASLRGVGFEPTTVFCQIFVGRFGVSFSPFERLFLGRF